MAFPSLVIFDCDGVLVDSEILAPAVGAEYLAEIGINISAAEIVSRYLGRSPQWMLSDIEARTARPLPLDFASELRDRILDRFRRDLKPMPGIADAIQGLNCAICVASSSGMDRIRLALTVTGLIQRFDPNIFSATQVQNGKPAPDLFLFVAGQMAVFSAHCLVIEDSEAGVLAGLAAGMRVIGFTGGGHCDNLSGTRLLAAGAHAVIGNMTGLRAAIAEIM